MQRSRSSSSSWCLQHFSTSSIGVPVCLHAFSAVGGHSSTSYVSILHAFSDA